MKRLEQLKHEARLKRELVALTKVFGLERGSDYFKRGIPMKTALVEEHRRLSQLARKEAR